MHLLTPSAFSLAAPEAKAPVLKAADQEAFLTAMDTFKGVPRQAMSTVAPSSSVAWCVKGEHT